MIPLYRALTGDYVTKDEELEEVSLNGVLFRNRKNDLAIRSSAIRLIILSEHQSTINENMPLRMLIYLGREYEKLCINGNIYGRKMIKLDRPEFVVFYNGTQDMPAESILRLSDAFSSESIRADMYDFDLVVRVYNLNRINEIPELLRCDTLCEYSEFVKIAQTLKKHGFSLEDPIKNAINYCINHGILDNYLKENSTEVNNMLLSEWKLEDELASEREEGREEGRREGIVNNYRSLYKVLHNANAAIRAISEEFHISEDEIKKILREAGEIE